MNKYRRMRLEIAHVLMCASDLARTSRGGLSDACRDTLGWDFYWPCRRVLEFLEMQLGYQIWSNWGEGPDPRRPDVMNYADALLEASAIATDHWYKVVDSLSMESAEVRRLRDEVDVLRKLIHGVVEDLPGQQDISNYYTGVFA